MPAFNVAFGMLAARFDYPDILRRPTDEVLSRFEAGGTGLVLLWWSFAMTAVLFAPLVVLLSQAIVDPDQTLLALATTVGGLAAMSASWLGGVLSAHVVHAETDRAEGVQILRVTRRDE
jgi:hypothetical protein